ncbi:uncharacterized protein YJR142W-like isoform X2 [Gigantopelta aegis]|uniref:uncharacterized protein YJR142W-like isoform X2 n=1 Tax=Gigantopelta aegis TaxID=1735272 RepID=UPI001B887AD6|nr:uncharacterized protein YJR142W-like isoform X2 [Gigantopelta aegis]
MRGSSRDQCLPFVVAGQKVGLVRPDIVEELRKFPLVFSIKESSDVAVHLIPDSLTVAQRTDVVAGVLDKLRQEDVLGSLRGWRDEKLDIRLSPREKPIMQMERAATCLFGTIQYGVHLNAYTYNESGEMMMWIGRRSETKQTYPGFLDNMCAGALPSGLGVTECLIKECQEEASVELSYFEKLTSVGTVSYCFEDERGVFPECQFVYDLVVPADFQPVNADGEVSDFQLVSMQQVKKLIISSEFKPNCALVILDFMIRHGFITADEDPNYTYLVQQMHVPLQSIFSGHL